MVDLSKELTVFVITVSNDVNYDECIEALEKQTTKFKLEIIKDYTPLSKAFQEMLNRCKTNYYIEVDSDMILNVDAVEKLYNKITAAKNKLPIICLKLLDVHLNFEIYGIKIYNFYVFKKYPYNLKHPSCEVEQLGRMEKDGYDVKNICIGEVVGKHSPNWTEETIFERYYNLMEKFKLYHYVWLERLPKMLINIYQKNPTMLNYYALAGMMSSICSDKVMNEEKNINTKRKDFKKMEAFLTKPHQATIYMTSACNFKCPWCYRQHNEIEQSADASVLTVNKLLAKFPEIRGVCVCGFGEPLMSNNLVPVLQQLKAANKIVGLITNGSLLAKRITEANANNLIGWYSPDYISVSLNAHDKATHQKVTGTDTWDAVLDGIRVLVASKIPCYVSYVTTSENLVFIPDFLKLCVALGVKTAHLHNVLPHFNEAKNEDFWKLALTKDAHTKFIEEYKKLPEASIVKKWPTLIDKKGGKQECKFPFSIIAINGNGSLSVCNSVYPCSKEMFGNIEDPVVWNSEKICKFRSAFLDKKIDVCKKCFRNFEWGNC